MVRSGNTDFTILYKLNYMAYKSYLPLENKVSLNFSLKQILKISITLLKKEYIIQNDEKIYTIANSFLRVTSIHNLHKRRKQNLTFH